MLSRAVRRTKAAQERVTKRVAAGLCLSKHEKVIDGKSVEVDCSNKAGKRRGVCDACYSIFLKEASKGTPEESFQYEQEMIAAGLVLADREKIQLKSNSLLQRRRA